MNLTIILRSNGGIYNPNAQDFILKATTSAYTAPESACQVVPQDGSGRVPDRRRSTFNSKSVSNPSFSGGATFTSDMAKDLEDAFWKNKQLQRRKITSIDVITAYGNDRTSLRSGFFLQKLCLQNILHDNKKVIPDQVIQEFNREPARHNMYKLAIARFKAECCLRGLPLFGQPVIPDAVVRAFP
ncbi:hypothetical protein, partial [Endozoicomonas sp. SESOKO1]|uniref:hypothetical protein n=1 Tax=Endozoicomonas sp. SESOKO1 TaxID=2828742 RepID=UPI002148E913